MKTIEFLSLLKENEDKSLLFEYKKGTLVGANYHITEVKNITVDSVDCGAGTDFWKETVIQLWESPTEKEKNVYMTTNKALSILNKVDGMKQMERQAEVKFEYSNADFHTAQLFVHDYEVSDSTLKLVMNIEKTDCKAKEDCGVPLAAESEKEACCSPEVGCY